MLYIDDKFTQHPKILKASTKLGSNGAAQAIALYLDGLSYARQHLTDGFLPDAFVCNSALVSNPTRVAFILSSREIHLWHRVRGGYQIHDYHDWNRNASEVKQKRESDRIKKQRQRKGNGGVSRGLSRGDTQGDSRARASTNHDPLKTGQLSLVPLEYLDQRTSTGAASRRGFPQAGEKHPEDTDATDAVATALCHREGSADSRPDADRRGMGGAHQGHRGGPAEGVPDERPTTAGDARGRASEAAPVAAAPEATATDSAAAGRPAVAPVSAGPRAVELGRSVDHDLDGDYPKLAALKGVLARLA